MQLGLSQTAFAVLLQTGAGYVSDYERSKRPMGIRQALRFCERCKGDPAQWLTAVLQRLVDERAPGYVVKVVRRDS